MSIKINTRFGEIVTSQALNEKIDTLFGGNAIISGFDVARETDTSVCVTPGKAIVCGASIEEDRDSITVQIPSNLISLEEVYAVLEYIHDHKRANFKITNSITSNMALLATITMQGGLITKINNSQKTGQLNELSMVAKDLSTGILNTQHLTYSGNNITMENSINAKTQDIKIKGVTKQNLVQSANKEVYVSAEYETEEAAYHKLTDTKDGYLDLNIKGRTLKSVCPLSSGWSQLSTLISIDNGVLTYTSIGNKNAYGNFFSKLNVGQLKPSAEYTFIVRITSNTLVFSDDRPWDMSIVFGGRSDYDSAFIKEYAFPSNVSPGYYVFKLQTKDSFDNITVANRGYVSNYCVGGSISFSYMILEGDVSDAFLENIPYINGIESAAEKENNVIEIMSSGKNILPLEILRHQMASVDIANQTLTVSRTNPQAYDFYQKDITHLLKDGVTYTLSANYSDSTYGHYGVDCFDNLTKQRVHINVKTFTVNLNLYYYVVKFYTNKTDQPYSGDISVTYSNIQLEEGKSPTSYEAYKEHKLRYVLPEPLRSLPNGVCDEITADGMVVQRVGKVVFNGSEDWKTKRNADGITNRYDLNFDKFKRYDGIVDHIVPNMYCDRLSTKTFEQVYRGSEAGLTHYWSDKNHQTITVGLKDSKTSTEFKTWLLNNPITVYYELATPITYRLGSAALPNDVKDSIYDNKIIQRVGSITFDGSESSWNRNSERENSMVFVYMKNGIGPVLPGENYPVTPAVSNIIQPSDVDLAYPAKDIEGVYTAKDGRVCVAINKDRINGNDINSFKQWLSKNPLTVWYQLPEPKTISCNDPIRVRCYADTTHIKTTNALMPKIKVDSKGHKYPVLLKPNSKYTVSIRKNNDIGNEFSVNLGGAKSINEGYSYQLEITTPNQLTDNNLYISGWSTKTIKDVLVEEGGLESSCDLYIDGVCSVGVQKNNKFSVEIKSAGKNLFNKNNATYGRALALHNATYSDPDLFTSEHISVKPEHYYALHKAGWGWFLGYDKIKMGDYEAQVDGTTIVQTPKNCRFIAMTSRISKIDEVQIEEISFTNYDRYQSYLKTVELDEPLRSLPNGVCDEIVDGKLIRKVGEVVFDGSESWKLWYESSNTIGFIYNHNSIMDKNWYSSQMSLVCDRFIPKSGHNFNEDDSEAIAQWNTNNAIFVRINKRALKTLDVSGFKQWLAENPVTVLYELSKPVITDINADLNVRTFDDKTHVTTEGLVKAELEFKAPANLRAVVNQVADRITEAEKIVDELLLPNIVEVDYERTLLEFDYEVSKFNLEGDE